MTAEIVILNKTAVALAADSAVTIQKQKGQKIYNSANKLFMLSKYHPVGIMLFGKATFMGVPWETIIKEYRKLLGSTEYDTLKDYAGNFIKYLDGNIQLFPEKEQEKYCEVRITKYFLTIKDDVKKKAEEIINNKGKIEDAEISKTFSGIIQNHYEKWEKLPLLKNITDKDVEKFLSKYKIKIEKIVKNIFEKLQMNKDDFKKLSEISAGLFLRKRFLLNLSGIVIAGFGKKDIFPSLSAFKLECVVENKLKYTEQPASPIDFDNNAVIVPFAQTEMVRTFIEGVDPILEKFSSSYLERIFNNYPNVILKLLDDVKDGKKRKEILEKLTNASKQIFDNYKNKVGEYRRKNHIQPIVNIVAVLPKDELASVAEALVSLTSFKRRVTMDAETVGGPIDVAVISKGDGFVWIKRKHYFKSELNHQFFDNYYRERTHNKGEDG